MRTLVDCTTLTSPQWYATRISCLPCPRAQRATGSRLKIGERIPKSCRPRACSLLAPNPSSLHPVARRDVNGTQCCAVRSLFFAESIIIIIFFFFFSWRIRVSSRGRICCAYVRFRASHQIVTRILRALLFSLTFTDKKSVVTTGMRVRVMTVGSANDVSVGRLRKV